MTVECPVAAQVFNHGLGDGHHSVFVAFAATDPQLALLGDDVVDGEGEAFRKAQATAIDELDGDAVATQADVLEQAFDFVTGEHGGQVLEVFGANL